MDIRVEQCVLCGEGLGANSTLGNFADHLMMQVEGDGRCEMFGRLEVILNKVSETLEDGDLEEALDILNSLVGNLRVRAVLVAGNAILHFDKHYNGLGLTQPSYLLPSEEVWPDPSVMTFVQFNVFVLRYKALSVISSLEDMFRRPEYWDRIEAGGDNEQEIYGVRETKLCVVLREIALSDDFWDMAGKIVATVEPVLGLIIELTRLSSTLSTIYFSAKEVKKEVDLTDDLPDNFVAMVHLSMRRFGTAMHRAAGLFNPMHMTKKGLWSTTVVDKGMRRFFQYIVDEDDLEMFSKELDSYLKDGPMLGGTVSGYSHPAVWWHEHGPGMVTLARYALSIVSYPHSMNFMDDELPIERFVTTQLGILRPYEGVFNPNYGYDRSFEEFLNLIVAIEDDAELLPQFVQFY